MRDDLLPLIENQAINILGGCCGTNYDHIRAIAELVKGQKPRVLPEENLLETCLSGNEYTTLMINSLVLVKEIIYQVQNYLEQ